MLRTTETELLTAAVARLESLPGIKLIELSDPSVRRVGEKKGTSDGFLRVATALGEDTYVIEVKRQVTPRTLHGVLEQLQRRTEMTGKKPLLVTPHLNDQLVDALLEANVEFIDAAGNIHLQGPSYYVLIRGNKPGQPVPAETFTAAGLKVIYALLAFPELRRDTYRGIADVAGVGLGSVGRTVQGLLQQGYLIRGQNDTLHLGGYENLLNRWELGYLEVLRPRLKPTTWRLTSVSRDVLLEQLQDQNILIGGEEAAASLTGTLKPQTLTIHAPDELQKKLRLDLRLLPEVKSPDLYLLHPLTPHDRYLSPTAKDLTLIHPLLIRAELLALGGDRLREVAGELLQNVILSGFANA